MDNEYLIRKLVKLFQYKQNQLLKGKLLSSAIPNTLVDVQTKVGIKRALNLNITNATDDCLVIKDIDNNQLVVFSLSKSNNTRNIEIINRKTRTIKTQEKGFDIKLLYLDNVNKTLYVRCKDNYNQVFNLNTIDTNFKYLTKLTNTGIKNINYELEILTDSINIEYAFYIAFVSTPTATNSKYIIIENNNITINDNQYGFYVTGNNNIYKDSILLGHKRIIFNKQDLFKHYDCSGLYLGTEPIAIQKKTTYANYEDNYSGFGSVTPQTNRFTIDWNINVNTNSIYYDKGLVNKQPSNCLGSGSGNLENGYFTSIGMSYSRLSGISGNLSYMDITNLNIEENNEVYITKHLKKTAIKSVILTSTSTYRYLKSYYPLIVNKKDNVAIFREEIIEQINTTDIFTIETSVTSNIYVFINNQEHLILKQYKQSISFEPVIIPSGLSTIINNIDDKLQDLLYNPTMTTIIGDTFYTFNKNSFDGINAVIYVSKYIDNKILVVKELPVSFTLFNTHTLIEASIFYK